MYDAERARVIDGREVREDGGPLMSGFDPVMYDPVEFGRRLRGARMTAGFDSADAVSRALVARWGPRARQSPRGILAVERGEQPIYIDQFLNLLALYEPHGGIEFFYGATRPPELETLKHAMKRDDLWP